MKKLLMAIAGGMIAASVCAAQYRTAGTGTAVNEWTSNYDGVLAAAAQTGYPILMIVVDSNTCTHCHEMNRLTLSSAEFKSIENDLTFYRVMIDRPFANSATYSKVTSKYMRYFNSGMFPLVAVLRKDGSVYGSYGNAVTDKRNVSNDVRTLIEKLANEQGADIWSGSGVVPTVTDDDAGKSTPTPAAPSAASWGVKLKGASNGIVFDANGEIAGAVTVKVSNRAYVTCKFTLPSGKATVKGYLALNEDGEPFFGAGGAEIVYDTKANVWVGTWNGRKVVVNSTKPSAYSGIYTSAVANNGTDGYLTATSKGEKCTVAGLVGGRNKVSSSSKGVLVPASIVEEILPGWDVGTDMAFYPVTKRGLGGGFAISKSGAVDFRVVAIGKKWAGIGSRWAAGASVASLEGKTLDFAAGQTAVSIPLVWNGRTIVAANNDYKAKFKPNSRKGNFKGSAKVNGARYVFEGALLNSANGIVCSGITYGAGVTRVTVGEVDCNTCVVLD